MMAKTKHSQNQDLQDEKINRITENKSSKSNNSENLASDKWEIPSDWEVSQLGQLGTFSKGKGILKEQVIKEGLPCIRYGEIYTTHDFIIKKFKSFISENLAEESKEIKNGDILFAGSGETVEEIGKAVAYIKDEKAYAGGDIIILSTKKETNVSCLSYILETDFVKKQKRVLGQGNSVVHIYSSDLSKIKIPLPPLPEQIAIAQLLSTWDNAITNTQALIAQKEQRKKWLMQNLLTGKMRLKINDELGVMNDELKGFEGEWKEYELNKLCKISKGEQLNKDELEKSGMYPSISGGVNPSGYTEDWNTEANTIIISEGGNSCGYVNFIKTKFWCGGHCYALLNLSKIIERDFLFQALKFNEPQIMKLRVGSGLPNVQKKDIEVYKLNIPSIEEQTAIAQVLQAADKEIKLLKTKCDKLKEQKKGLMQQLLTGKIRLTI